MHHAKAPMLQTVPTNADTQLDQLLPGPLERPEVRRERNARQLPLQVVGELLAIAGVVQHAVDVIENAPLADRRVVVVLKEFVPDRPAVVIQTSISIAFPASAGGVTK